MSGPASAAHDYTGQQAVKGRGTVVVVMGKRRDVKEGKMDDPVISSAKRACWHGLGPAHGGQLFVP
jgi:hypothetical protein